MDIKTTVLKLVDALGHQNFSVSEKLYKEGFLEDYSYLSGNKQKLYTAISKFNQKFVNYDHIKFDEFESDLRVLQQRVSEKMLFAWGYQSGSLCLIGMIYADNFSGKEIESLFSRLDDGITNVMRKHVGKVFNGENGGLYGTMMLIFSDSNKSRSFNSNIKKYYNSHFWKQTYVSTVTIDCDSETLTVGKAAMGMNWNGGLDMSTLRKDVFG